MMNVAAFGSYIRQTNRLSERIASRMPYTFFSNAFLAGKGSV
jgi:hypothetical protein